MSASVSGMPGGQPSTTQPMAGPWLSPKVVTRKRWPKLLWDIRASSVAVAGNRSNIRRARILHSDDVIAGVDMNNFAGHGSPEVRQQEERGISHFLYGHHPPKRRVVFVPPQNIAEVADPGGRQGLDRSGRYGIDPDILLAEIGREIANRGLERRLGNAHDVVMRHPFLGAIIGQGEDRAASAHQALGALCHRGQAVTGK